jgi:hypothetical protein
MKCALGGQFWSVLFPSAHINHTRVLECWDSGLLFQTLASAQFTTIIVQCLDSSTYPSSSVDVEFRPSRGT